MATKSVSVYFLVLPKWEISPTLFWVPVNPWEVGRISGHWLKGIPAHKFHGSVHTPLAFIIKENSLELKSLPHYGPHTEDETVGRHDPPRCSGSAILQPKCLGFLMRQMLFLRGGGQGIFEDFQFGSWSTVPRLCLFPCLLLPDWLLPWLRAGGPSVWAVNAVGRWGGGSVVQGRPGPPPLAAEEVVCLLQAGPPPLGGSLAKRAERPPGRPGLRAPGADWVWEWVLARGPRGVGASGDPARSPCHSRAGGRAMSFPSGIWDTGAWGRLVIRLLRSLGETRGQGLCYSACSASSKGPGRPSSPAPHFTRAGGDWLPSCS